jgi:hypothetical protein
MTTYGYSYKWHLPKGTKQFESTTYGNSENDAINNIKINHPKRVIVKDTLVKFYSEVE